MVNTKSFTPPQPAPSGTPTVPENIKPHTYHDPKMQGTRKQLAIDLGIEAGRFVYNQFKQGDTYKKHNLDYVEIGIIIDFMYNEMYRLLYADKYPTDSTYKQPTSVTNRIGGVGGRQ